MNPDELRGHEERYAADVPALWSTMGRAHPAAWGLPSSTISVFSLLTWLVVFGLLAIPPSEHTTFRLPDDGRLGMAASLVILVVVGVVGSRRPGPLFPRLWVLSLGVATVVFMVALEVGLLGTGPLPAALAVATFAASFVLTARLLRLTPDSPLLRRIAPLTTLLVLVVMIPSSLAVQDHYEGKDRGAVEDMLAELRARRAAVDALAGVKAGTVGATDPAPEAVLAVSVRDVPELGPRLDAALVAARALDVKARTHLEDEIVAAYGDLVASLQVQGTRADAPWTSTVIADETPTRHAGRDRWVLAPDVSDAIGAARPFHASVEAALDAATASGALETTRARAASAIRGDPRRLTLTNAWAYADVGLDALFSAPITPGGELSLANLAGIFGMTHADAAGLDGPDTGCRWVELERADWVECFGFVRGESAEGRLAVVARVVYTGGSLPSQLYALLLPSDGDVTEAEAAGAFKGWALAAEASGLPARHLNDADAQEGLFREGFCASGDGGSFVARRVLSAANTTVQLEDGTRRTGQVVEVNRRSCPR